MAYPERWLAGTFRHANGDPMAQAPITFTLSDRLVDTSDNEVAAADSFTISTGDDGTFLVELHLNNDPLDAPINSHWSVLEPTGLTTEIFIDIANPNGLTSDDPIPYTSVITLPDDLPLPTIPGNIQDQIDAVNNKLSLLLDADTDGLTAIGASTILVDDVLTAANDATTSVHGLLTAADKQKLDDLGPAAKVAKYDASDALIIRHSTAAVATTSAQGRMWFNPLDATVRVLADGSTTQSILAPGFDAPAFQASSDIPITNLVGSMQTIATIPVVANALYLLTGDVGYAALDTVDLLLGFTGIPAGATLRWHYTGLANNVAASSNGIGGLNANYRTNTQTLAPGGQDMSTPLGLIISGTLRTGANGGNIVFKAAKNNAGTDATILAGSALFFDRRL